MINPQNKISRAVNNNYFHYCLSVNSPKLTILTWKSQTSKYLSFLLEKRLHKLLMDHSWLIAAALKILLSMVYGLGVNMNFEQFNQRITFPLRFFYFKDFYRPEWITIFGIWEKKSEQIHPMTDMFLFILSYPCNYLVTPQIYLGNCWSRQYSRLQHGLFKTASLLPATRETNIQSENEKLWMCACAHLTSEDL